MSTLARRTAPPLTPLSILAQRLLPLPLSRHPPPPSTPGAARRRDQRQRVHPHVRERVHLLGADWEQFLAADLDEEALSFLKADHHTLAWHRGRYLREAPDGHVAAVGGRES